MRSKSLSLVICTYNRPKKVVKLVEKINSINFEIDIIIVDSSEKNNVDLISQKLTYLKSSHKNQPYQRYLGYKVASSDYIIYLDDDMEIVDYEFLEKITTILSMNKKLSGIALKFEDQYPSNINYNQMKSIFVSKNTTLNKIKRFLSASPVLSDGKAGLCGNKGKQPMGGGYTEWLSGGAFLAKRKLIFKNLNFSYLIYLKIKMEWERILL